MSIFPRRHRQVYRPHSRGAGRPRTARPCRQCAWRADRRQEVDQCQVSATNREVAPESSGASRVRSPVQTVSRPSTRWFRWSDRTMSIIGGADRQTAVASMRSSIRRAEHVLHLRRDGRSFDVANVVRKLQEHARWNTPSSLRLPLPIRRRRSSLHLIRLFHGRVFPRPWHGRADHL